MGIIRILLVAGMSASQIRTWIQSRLSYIFDDSVLRIKVHGNISEKALQVLSALSLRALAPATMNVNATLLD
jgi:hypothetical protein